MNNVNHALITLVLGFATTSMAHGHGGGLNEYGCHRQTSDNTYHCHTGVLDGQSFSSEQGMMTAFYSTSGGGNPNTPSTAYNRSDYMTSWRDNDVDCLDTRNEVLATESLVAPTFSANGCDVIQGFWRDPYSGQSFTNPSDLDIDHMVPLAEAHASGASVWSTDKKSAYANDLLNAKALIAVSASANRSKGSRDPAQWLPTNTEYHCDYVKDWVEVKRRHGLEIDPAEATAIESVLESSIEFSARAESTGWNQSTGEASTAVFGLGMRLTDQCAYTRQARPTDDIEITISVLPDAAHLGHSFKVFLVAELTNGLFSLNPLGQFVPYTGTIDSLVSFKGNVSLNQTYEFTAFSGVLNDSLAINLYLGYLTDAGSFIYTLAPLPLSIGN